MYIMIFGCILFFGTHIYAALRTRNPAKDVRLKMGSGKYRGLFSLFSAIGFILMVWGYDLARPSPELYTPPDWGRFVTMAAMLPAFILIFVTYAPYGYIRKWVQHPMLLSIGLWSGGHLFSNAELNSVILFGSFLVFTLMDRIAVIGRATRLEKPPSLFSDIFSVLFGTGLYWLFLTYLHTYLIGVSLI